MSEQTSQVQPLAAAPLSQAEMEALLERADQVFIGAIARAFTVEELVALQGIVRDGMRDAEALQALVNVQLMNIGIAAQLRAQGVPS